MKPQRLIRLGFTMVELLVAISIAGILMSFLLPAIQAARETARSARCGNQIRQLTLGIHNHQSRYGVYPTNGGDQDDSLISDASGFLVPIRTHDLQIGASFRWGIGTPGAHPNDQPGCWAYAIMPDVEQSNPYESMMVEEAGTLFLCPSRSRDGQLVPIDDINGQYEAGDRAWAKTDYAANAFGFLPRPRALGSRDITDGLSHTIALGEKAFDPNVQTGTSWYWDEPVFSGGSRGTVRSGSLIEQDRTGCSYKNQWGSGHPGYAMFAFFDGSVRRIEREIDLEAFRASLTPNAKEPDAL